MKHHCWLLAGLLLALVGCSSAQTRGQSADETDQEDEDIKNVKTIGDITVMDNVKPIQVSGVGLVYGLDGTGGGVPNNEWRQRLEDQLHKQGVQDVKAMLNSPKYTMVFVTALIPPGIRKGEPLDIEVTLPPQSKATSLRGGRLFDCVLRNYDTTRNLDKDAKSNVLLEGHILAKARGPLLVGFGEGQEEVRLRRGRIWEGGVSLIEMPLYLCLQDDQRHARVANEVAQRINAAFPDDPHKQAQAQKAKRLLVLDEVTSQINTTFQTPTGRGQTAKAINQDLVYVNVPFQYRLNPERYMLVLRKVPLYESPETAGKYRQRLHEMLLDPKDTVRAALRLEALGKESVQALKKGLSSTCSLVRFASAEALTYLGSTAGIEELARLADQYEILRGHCVTAMASMDESISQMKLVDLLASAKPQLRFGAFRALLAINEQHVAVKGVGIRDAFWLHKVAPKSPPMVHVSTSRRAEIVLFGQTPKLVPPFRIPAGNEFTLTAEDTDSRLTVSRYVSTTSTPRVTCKQCSFDLEEVLRVVVELGGEYPDAVELLRQVDRHKCLTCEVVVDALPSATPITLLAAAGGNADQFKDQPEEQREVMAVQQALGITVPEGTGKHVVH
jgi:hypothetical protein